MAKKKNQNSSNNNNNTNNNNNNNNNNENENVNVEEGCGCGKKQKSAAGGGVSVVVLKMDLHCEGCAGRVVKAVRTLDGVESVRIGDSELSKITVIGTLDPAKLRQKVEEKTKKKVELVSPAAKKANDGDGNGGDNKKQQKQPQQQQQQQPPSEKPKTAVKKDDKKPKEIPVTTAVLKVPLHCQGCVRRIHKLVSKTKGFMEISIDKNKDLVTVKGAIDVKLLVEALQHKLKRVVEIVPPKKEGGGDGEKKGKGGGGGGGGGGEKKGKENDGGEGKGGKGGGGDGGDGGGGGKMEVMKMENYGAPTVFPYPQYGYGSGYADYVHAPQLFSDENPHACIVM